MRQSNNQTGSGESRRGHWQKPDNTPNSEERALQRFAQMMIEKISSFQGVVYRGGSYLAEEPLRQGV